MKVPESKSELANRGFGLVSGRGEKVVQVLQVVQVMQVQVGRVLESWFLYNRTE